MILLTLFAEQRNEKPDTIRKYINRHMEDFEGHFEIKGKQMELDEVAAGLLEQKYPLPRPVQVVNGVDPEEYADALKKISQLQEAVIKLQQARQEDLQKLAAAEATQILLEDKEEALRELKEEYDYERTKRTEAEDELAKLRNRSLWQRIFNK